MRQARRRKSYGNSNPGRYTPKTEQPDNPEMSQMLPEVCNQLHKRINEYVLYIGQPPDTPIQVGKASRKRACIHPGER